MVETNEEKLFKTVKLRPIFVLLKSIIITLKYLTSVLWFPHYYIRKCIAGKPVQADSVFSSIMV